MPRHAWLRTTLLTISTLGASSAVPALAAAQGDSLPRKNAMVRVLLPATPDQPQRIVAGRLVALEHDTVTIAVGSGPVRPTIVSFGLDGGRQLQRRVEGRGHGGRGAAIGAAVGALAGAVIGLATYKPCEGLCFMDGEGYAAMGGAFVGAAGGALIGFVAGSASRPVGWVPLQTAGVRVAVGPRTLGLHAEF